MSDYATATIQWGVNSLTLLQLLKQQLDMCDNDTSRDEELSLWLQMAGLACEAYCDNVLCLQEATERHACTFSPITLRYHPVQSITSVTVDGVDATADYELFFDVGLDYATISRTGASKGDKFNQMDLVYQAGLEPMPADLGYAIVLTATSYESQTSGTGLVKKESVVGVGSIEYATGDDEGGTGVLSATTTSVLDKYRRCHV